MNEAAQILQQSLFQAIEADETLLSVFALYGGDASGPQFSYDGMVSNWRDRPAEVSTHLVGFSVWTQQAGLADGYRLLSQLDTLLARLVLPPPYRLHQSLMQNLDSGPDSATRQWRQQINHQLVVHKERL